MPGDPLTTACPCSYGAPQDCPHHAEDEHEKTARRTLEHRTNALNDAIEELEAHRGHTVTNTPEHVDGERWDAAREIGNSWSVCDSLTGERVGVEAVWPKWAAEQKAEAMNASERQHTQSLIEKGRQQAFQEIDEACRLLVRVESEKDRRWSVAVPGDYAEGGPGDYEGEMELWFIPDDDAEEWESHDTPSQAILNAAAQVKR